MASLVNRKISMNVEGLSQSDQEDLQAIDMLKTETFCICPGLDDDEDDGRDQKGQIDFDGLGLTQKSISCSQSTTFSRRERQKLFKQAAKHYRMCQFQMAIEILKRMIQDLENMCDKNNVQINTYDLSRYRILLGNSYYQLKQYELAKSCYNFKYSRSTQTLQNQAQRLNNLGCCYAMTKDSSCLAFSSFSQSLSIYSKLGIVKYGIYLNIANIYRCQKMPYQSSQYYQLALQFITPNANQTQKALILRLYLWSFLKLDFQSPSVIKIGQKIIKEYLNYILFLRIDRVQLRFDLLVSMLGICFNMNKVTYMEDIFTRIADDDAFKALIEESQELLILSAQIYFKMATEGWKSKTIKRQTYEDYLKKAKAKYAKYLQILKQQNLCKKDSIKQSIS